MNAEDVQVGASVRVGPNSFVVVTKIQKYPNDGMVIIDYDDGGYDIFDYGERVGVV